MTMKTTFVVGANSTAQRLATLHGNIVPPTNSSMIDATLFAIRKILNYNHVHLHRWSTPAIQISIESFMTIKFLRQSPRLKESTAQLAAMLGNGDGRLYVLTGGISETSEKIQDDLIEIIKWASASTYRELVFLVGVFYDKNGNYDEEAVADKLATLMSCAINKANLPKLSLNARFFAARQWHAKAIGLTGTGGRFLSAKAAIFGSTNFTHSARHGENFELDTFIDDTTLEHAAILRDYTLSIGLLIQEAIQAKKYPNFEGSVRAKIMRQTNGATFKKTTINSEKFWSLEA